jgi:hypothetical protein
VQVSSLVENMPSSQVVPSSFQTQPVSGSHAPVSHGPAQLSGLPPLQTPSSQTSPTVHG